MKYFLYISGILLVSIFMMLVSCDKRETSETNYAADLENYWKEKSQSRKEGYLQLVALSKLTDSSNVFGKHNQNQLVLAIERLPDTIGVFQFRENALYFDVAPEIEVKTMNDSLINSIALELDTNGNSQKLKYNHILWQLITRDNSPYLRVWDTKNPEINTFKGFERYATNQKLVFEADFNYFNTVVSASVKSKLGVQATTQFIGQLRFDHQGNSYTLDVGNKGFVMLADPTNGNETYGGGRYVYIDLPKGDGKVTVDFNKLYNPPCAYNNYTTCLYPPKQNKLPFAVLAGETMRRI